MSFAGREVFDDDNGPVKPPVKTPASRKSRLSVSEGSSHAHRRFRESNEGHLPHAGLDSARSTTGVIWVTDQAAEHGLYDDPEGTWANLGQGAPDAHDNIPGCFARPKTINVAEGDREYGPTAGIRPLREAVARLYNEEHRQGKESQYTWENVCIVPGGRAGLTRIAAILGNSYLGFFIPDYTAYTDCLSLFRNFSAIPIPLSAEDGYQIHPEKIAEEIRRGTSVILTSNPRNPTGHTVKNPGLAKIQDICRDRATLIMDEFYGGYNYTSGCDGSVVSAAENVIDVNSDDVLIIDGLTKRFRLPSFRIAWVLGPKEFISALASSGSYLDGGANVPFQKAAVPFLEPSLVRTEMKALQSHFMGKRDYVIGRLQEVGFVFDEIPTSTFYIWLDLRTLEPPVSKECGISDGLSLMTKLLKEKTVVVPGIFFDVNPSKRRDLFDSPCHHFVRISYGPNMEHLKKGMDAIERVVKRARDEDSKYELM